ncbi:Erv1/Alr [Metarhizium guizhouense ARSEF 977]|uniref:Sulfhydryl oxidase n=1 Tax=Metarhizium guizhouense (strain ARSEF 977) TaxID=1276136 RepID=A0A0B4I1M6_METGA|nr:Erv1/Alr [Metarhizium guizhouense ARSEF 977]
MLNKPPMQGGGGKRHVVLALLVSALFSNVGATPSHYRMASWPRAVQSRWAMMRDERVSHGHLTAPKMDARTHGHDDLSCGIPDESQPMWFTQGGCSIASQDLTYVDTSGQVPVVRTAAEGHLVKLTCEDVFCPIPPRLDCYEQPGICSANEWCMIDIHERWGPWAMNRDGSTPQWEYCYKAADFVGNSSDQALINSYYSECVANTIGDYGIKLGPKIEAWKPIRGKCVKFRQAEQSCIGNPLEFGAYEREFGLNYKREEDGAPFPRPLVCGPGLTCTGPDFDVRPSTCVHQRPQNICFAGPWWDSTQCPRTEPEAPKGGLTREQTVETLRRAVLLYPGEIATAADCAYWNRSSALGISVLATQHRFYNIAAALWPTDLFGEIPSFDELMALIPDPNLFGSPADCVAQADIPGSEINQALAEGGTLSNQPNQVWSLVHFLMHNQPIVLSSKKIAASRAMAAHLSESFWCDDCRGFFSVGVIERYGLPPESSNPDDQAHWWWWGHNVASEHVASTRGGHPWIHELGDEGVAYFQNPYFMTWEDAVAEWTYSI